MEARDASVDGRGGGGDDASQAGQETQSGRDGPGAGQPHQVLHWLYCYTL